VVIESSRQLHFPNESSAGWRSILQASITVPQSFSLANPDLLLSSTSTKDSQYVYTLRAVIELCISLETLSIKN
jgi:hypothetical protein